MVVVELINSTGAPPLMIAPLLFTYPLLLLKVELIISVDPFLTKTADPPSE